jgi:hypothetical protein
MSHTTVTTDTTGGGSASRSLIPDQVQLRRGLGVIACGLVVGVAFVASYVGALHKPTFHQVSIAVAGPAALARQLGSGSELSVNVVSSPDAAVRAIDDRRDFGGVAVTRTGITVYIAQAAGPSVASTLASTLPAALRAGAGGRVPIRVSDIKPLPDGDPTGAGAFYLVLSLVVSNYIGAILFALAFGTKLKREELLPRLLVASCIAVMVAAGEVGITHAIGPLSGHFLALLLAAFLLGITVSTVTLCLQALLGVVGTTIAILIFVVFGNPASGGGFPFPLLPGLWRGLGPYTPSGAGVTLVRNIVYFGGHGTGFAALVLSGWLAAALALTFASVRLRPIGLRMKSDYDRLPSNVRTV